MIKLVASHYLLPSAWDASSGFVGLAAALPADLHEVIGAKGHRYRDDLTKASLYCARRVAGALATSGDATGVVCATAFGNFKSGRAMLTQAHASSAPFSAQIFPNVTYSSSAVTVSLELGARGVNLTLTAGETGLAAALQRVADFAAAGRLADAIVLVGDDFDAFPACSVARRVGGTVTVASSMSGFAFTTSAAPVPGLTLRLAETAREPEPVLEALATTLGADWRDRYLVDASGPTVAAGEGTIYWGPSLAALQLRRGLAALDAAGERHDGLVLLTSAPDGGLGAIALDRPYLETSEHEV
jgi:hypothetical protein